MFISIIIPTRDRQHELTICLLSLANQYIADDIAIEVIVCDDSETCSARGLLHHQAFGFAKWVKGPGIGPAANRNTGAAYASGDWFAFLDDDCIPDDDYIGKLRETIMCHPEAVLFEGLTYPGRLKLRYDEETVSNPNGGCLWPCNLVIHRHSFLKLKGFCEEFTHAALEDIDLLFTTRQRNIPVHFVPDVRVCHPWRRRKPLSSRLKMIGSIRLLCRRHPEARERFNRLLFSKQLLLGIYGRTRSLVHYRFKGILAYLEDNLILLYYLIRL